MKDNHMEFILSRSLHNMSHDEQRNFVNALHIMPTWKQAIPITVEYLSKLNTPIAKIITKYSTKMTTGSNHAIKECSYPRISGLGVGAIVMLLKNYIAELGLMNGAVGTVQAIVYKNKEGPREKGALPAYVVVDFPSCTIPNEKKLIYDKPRTFVPVPVNCFNCERFCCSAETIPL